MVGHCGICRYDFYNLFLTFPSFSLKKSFQKCEEGERLGGKFKNEIFFSVSLYLFDFNVNITPEVFVTNFFKRNTVKAA